MKRLTIIACAFILAVFTLSSNSFGQATTVHTIYDNPNNPAIFNPTYNDLMLDIPGVYTGPADVVFYIEWLGEETNIITANDKYHHQVMFEWAGGEITIMPYTIENGNKSYLPFTITIDITIETGSASNHGTATDPQNPESVDILLRASSAEGTIATNSGVTPFALGPGVLKIGDKQMKFLKIARPAPPKSKIRATTFGRIKAK